jgi:hypothetical protein
MLRPNVFTFNAAQFETLLYATYYAPRGRQRLYMLAGELAHRYLYPTDLLIGIIGGEGAGKSTLIKGLFSGLELTNDDEGVNLRPTPIYDFQAEDFFAPHTFHLDIRYELAFHQKFEIIDAINRVIEHGRRVVIEHFDLIYDALGHNAHLLFGIGEEVIVARPTIFGPFPARIKSIVDKTIKFRLMAHSAEDITSYILANDYNYHRPVLHSDVKHGFVIKFPEKPEIDLTELERRVREVIAKDVPIGPAGENKLRIGDWHMLCTGPRTHIKSSGQIENFRLMKELMYDQLHKEFLLVGTVGTREAAGLEDIGYITDGTDREDQNP